MEKDTTQQLVEILEAGGYKDFEAMDSLDQLDFFQMIEQRFYVHFSDTTLVKLVHAPLEDIAAAIDKSKASRQRKN